MKKWWVEMRHRESGGWLHRDSVIDAPDPFTALTIVREKLGDLHGNDCRFFAVREHWAST